MDKKYTKGWVVHWLFPSWNFWSRSRLFGWSSIHDCSWFWPFRHFSWGAHMRLQNKKSSFFLFWFKQALPWNQVCTNFQITVILKVTTQLLEGDKPIEYIFFYHQTSSTHKLAFIPSLQVQYFKLRQIWGQWQFDISKGSQFNSEGKFT